MRGHHRDPSTLTTSASSASSANTRSCAPHADSSNPAIAVQHLVLEALCPTWPAYAEVVTGASVPSASPASSDEQIMAILTKSMRPNGTTVSGPRAHSCEYSTLSARNLRYECSRFGTSAMMLSRWALRTAPVSKALEWYVSLPNPLTAGEVVFRVLECVPPLPPVPSRRSQPPSNAMRAPEEHLAAFPFVAFASATAMESCVSFYPMDLCCTPSSTPSWVLPQSTLEKLSTSSDDQKNVDASRLGSSGSEPWVREVELELLRSLNWLATSSSHINDALPMSGGRSVLVHGPSSVGKSYHLRQLLSSLPGLVTITSGDEEQQHVRLSTRYVSVPPLFEQSAHTVDAARALCSMVQPSRASVPFAAPPAKNATASSRAPMNEAYYGIADGAVCSKSMLVVVLDGVDVLGTNSEELFVMTAAHALAETLEGCCSGVGNAFDAACAGHCDTASSASSIVVVIAVSTDPSAIHPVLCSSGALMGATVEATPPSAALRAQLYLRHHKLPHGGPLHSEVSSWLDASAGWTVPQMEDYLSLQHSTLTMSSTVGAPAPSTTNASSLLSRMIGVEDVVDKVERLLLFPFRHRKLLAQSGVSCPRGALIVGPSGAGKTALLAALHSELRLPASFPASSPEAPQVLAHGAQQHRRQLHVVLVDALSLVHKEVGRSEKNIQALLAEARASAPSVVFLDNLDAIAPPRGKSTRETNITADRTLSTLLVELDGVRDHHEAEVLVIASAPSVESLDPAMVRPGRLDLHLQLALPTANVLATLIARRLTANPETLLLDSPTEAQPLLERVAAEAIEAAGRPLTYADGVAAVRAVALRAFDGGVEASGVVVTNEVLEATVRETLLQR